MAIGTSGQFEDEEQFTAFGKLLKETFGQAIVKKEYEKTTDTVITLTLPENKTGKFLVMREKIDNGQRIKGFKVSVNSKSVYESECIGHKRIVPLAISSGDTVTLEITKAENEWQLRDVAVY